MARYAVISRAVVAKKPPHGSPCNRCGVCCMVAQCDLSRLLFGEKNGPCQALEKDGDEYHCGVVRSPTNFAPATVTKCGEDGVRDAIALIIRAGIGCDARINGEPINHTFNYEVDTNEDPAARRHALEMLQYHEKTSA